MKAYLDAENQIVLRRKGIPRAILVVDLCSRGGGIVSRNSLISQNRLVSGDGVAVSLKVREECANLNDIGPVATADIQNRG